MKRHMVIQITMWSILSGSAGASELQENIVYRTRVNLPVTGLGGSFGSDRVGAQSKFVVLDNDADDRYAVEFLNVRQVVELKNVERVKDDYKTYRASDVTEDEIYFLPKGAIDGIPIEKVVRQSFGGLSSGPLVVPFKYRLDDKSIGSEATIGYYAGWGWDVPLGDRFVTFTPFVSGGLTQVSVTSVSDDGTVDSDNQSGFSWATGLLVKNWDSLNIGIVYGQDRIGDSNWVHEGKGWLSISIGWDL